ncbi:MAG: hypothetical protein IID30_16025, partial [Planctomycetes bacterium]|nr:hypothetical protein [Planctomycetota bacterium]
AEADALFTQACEKYADAVRIKPDKHEALYNLACVEALRGDVDATITRLRVWAEYHPAPSRLKIVNDEDFDRVRDDPTFMEFVNTLPQ